MTAVRTAGAYPKTAESLTKKAAALWRRLNRTEEAPNGGFDDTYCMCRFLQAPLNRVLDSAMQRITSPCTVQPAAAAKPRRRRECPMHPAAVRPALEGDI